MKQLFFKKNPGQLPIDCVFTSGRSVLDLAVQQDVDQLRDADGQMVQIVADGGADAGELLTAVHSELVKRKCCY